MKLSPRQAMGLAIEEAKRGAGFVSPNPLVGCVILDSQGELIASGYHAKLGEGHAEVNALAAIRNPSKLDGAQVFVTLEPCAHQGRTPSCAQNLAGLTISSVTYGLKDPNPQVAGKGAEILKRAGKVVIEFSEMKDELEDVAEIFLKNMRSKRPFVAIKVGSSLDGQIALKNGESKWITNEESRDHVQKLRGAYDAVLVGSNTFLKDNPSLNSRDPYFAQIAHRAILIDPEGRSFQTLKQSKLFSVRKPEEIYIVVRSTVDWPKDLGGIHRIAIDKAAGELPWDEILEKLFEAGIMSVLVEGGAYVAGQLLKEKMADRLYVYVAPKILGSTSGLSWTSSFGIEKLQDALTLSRVQTQMFGSDVLITGRL